VAETDTHVFAAADNSFSRDIQEFSVAYTWPFDVHDLAHGLDTKALRGIMDRLGDLNNRTHHNLSLKKALAAVKADQLTHPVYHDLVNSHQHYLVSILALIIVCLSVIVGLLFVYGRRFWNDLRSDLRQGKQAIRQLEEDVAHLRQLAIMDPFNRFRASSHAFADRLLFFRQRHRLRSSNALNPTPEPKYHGPHRKGNVLLNIRIGAQSKPLNSAPTYLAILYTHHHPKPLRQLPKYSTRSCLKQLFLDRPWAAACQP
jgi:hypothetical protein